MKLQFTKMHGIGNDFILFDDRSHTISDYISYNTLSKKLCNRRKSIGADGIIILQEPSATCGEQFDFRFRIFNSDGSEPQMCGNGMRCFAKYLRLKGISSVPKLRIQTESGLIIPELITNALGETDRVMVDMGVPVLDPSQIPFTHIHNEAVSVPLLVQGTEHLISAVSMGNPHAVIFVDNIETAPVESLGPVIECHERFPEKTNVEFAEILSPTRIRMKVWERGAGITLACGTGACAVLVAAVLEKKSKPEATVILDGGELMIRWDQHTGHIFKSGPAEVSFEGNVEV
jgi:diaminopimelate epimerase